MKSMNNKALKIAGVVISILGFAVSCASDWIGEKMVKATVVEEVARILAERDR